MSLDFITEKQSYTTALEEAESSTKLYKLMTKYLCEFIVNSRKLTEPRAPPNPFDPCL